jgi:hypothetical protein
MSFPAVSLAHDEAYMKELQGAATCLDRARIRLRYVQQYERDHPKMLAVTQLAVYHGWRNLKRLIRESYAELENYQLMNSVELAQVVNLYDSRWSFLENVQAALFASAEWQALTAEEREQMEER